MHAARRPINDEIDGPCTEELVRCVEELMTLESLITCPHCATAKAEIMPTDACRSFYQCTGCGAMLRPKPGDCCVFCSYGSVPCPPKQAERANDIAAASRRLG